MALDICRGRSLLSNAEVTPRIMKGTLCEARLGNLGDPPEDPSRDRVGCPAYAGRGLYECGAHTYESESCSVASDSLRPHGLYSPWNSPGQNTGVGSLSLLQGIFPTQGSNPGLLHCRRILYQLSHKRSLCPHIVDINYTASHFTMEKMGEMESLCNFPKQLVSGATGIETRPVCL